MYEQGYESVHESVYNIVTIGRNIARLRQEKEMTQSQLADQMGISFQAVSNWERGQSAPDIAKLYELSNIFKVTIDEILGNQRSVQIITEIKKREPVEDITPEELEELGPVLTPAEADHLTQTLPQLTLKDFQAIAPFISTQRADQLYEEFQSSVHRMDELLAIVPFVSTKRIDQTLSDMAEQGREYAVREITTIAPFASTSVLDQLFLQRAKESVDIRELVELAPFVSASILDDLLLESQREGVRVKELVVFAPFASQDTLDLLAKELFQTGDHMENLVGLAPFISTSVLDELLLQSKQEGVEVSKLVRFAPFVSSTVLQELVVDSFENDTNPKGLQTLAPFLTEEFLDQIIDRYVSQEKDVAEEKTREKEPSDSAFRMLLSQAPLLEKSKVDEGLRALIEEQVPLEKISLLAGIAPFAGEKALEEMLKYQIVTYGDAFSYKELEMFSGFVDICELEDLLEL